MAEFDRTEPYYQDVDGFLIPGGFSTQVFRASLRYVPRDDDVFVATYPKCGTTWAQQIVYLIYNRGRPAGSQTDFFLCTPFLELFGPESGEQMPRPGAIKIHLPFQLTPYSDKAKYLYVVRNPKDVCVSYYHHMITDPVFTFQEGSFERFFEDFVSGRIAFNDYFDNVLSWYEHRHDPNVMFLTYEEMKRDPKASVLKIGKFLGEQWFDMLQKEDDVLEKVLERSSIDFMKTLFNGLTGSDERQSTSGWRKTLYPGLEHMVKFNATHSKDTDDRFLLVRKGQTGGWRDVLSKEQAERLDERVEKELGNTDLYTYWKSIGCI